MGKCLRAHGVDESVAKITTMQQLERWKVATRNATTPNRPTNVVDSLTNNQAGLYKLPLFVVALFLFFFFVNLGDDFCLTAALILGWFGIGECVREGIAGVFFQGLVATLWTSSRSCGRTVSFGGDCWRWCLGWRWILGWCWCCRIWLSWCNNQPCFVTRLLPDPLDVTNGRLPLSVSFAI